MGKTKGTVGGEVADMAQGAANVAANNAAVESAHRGPGRPKSDKLTFAAFKAAMKSGIIPDGVKCVAQVQVGNRVVTFMHWETENPVLTLDDEGNLSLAHFATKQGYAKPEIRPVKTIKYADLIKLLS